ncbi:MAG: 4Fe-4S binding protein [Treponemataceae bacterium]
MKRKIIAINEDLCDGCGLCANGCPEGALKIVDGKARLVGDLLCDGLGACIGTCPRGAILVEEREAVAYEERRVMEDNIVPKGSATIKAHLDHLRDHGEDAYLKIALTVLKERGIEPPTGYDASAAQAIADPHTHGGHNVPAGCPGMKAFAFKTAGQATGFAATPSAAHAPTDAQADVGTQKSELRQWPIQLHLVNPRNPQFRGSNLLLAADCAAFSVGDFHSRFLKNKTLAIACPKLDEGLDRYTDKLAVMIDEAMIDTLTVLRMHVPCCGGLVKIAQDAREKARTIGSGRNIPIKSITVDPEGNILQEVWL